MSGGAQNGSPFMARTTRQHIALILAAFLLAGSLLPAASLGLAPPVSRFLFDEEDEEARKKREEEEAKAKEEEERKQKEEEERKKKEEEENNDETSVNRNELARLRRIAKEADEAKKKADEEKAAADRKKKQEEGRWQELVNEAEKGKTEAEKERDAAKAELVDYKFQVAVNRVADRLNFKDPSDAHKFLDNVDKDADEKTLEHELGKVLKAKPYLQGDRKSTGGRGGGKNGGGSWNLDEIRSMSTDQINENWDKPGFQEAIAQAQAA